MQSMRSTTELHPPLSVSHRSTLSVSGLFMSNLATLPNQAATVLRTGGVNERCRQDSNLRGGTPMDFKSIALTTRPRQHRSSSQKSPSPTAHSLPQVYAKQIDKYKASVTQMRVGKHKHKISGDQSPEDAERKAEGHAKRPHVPPLLPLSLASFSFGMFTGSTPFEAFHTKSSMGQEAGRRCHPCIPVTCTMTFQMHSSPVKLGCKNVKMDVRPVPGASARQLRWPGIEPGSTAWKAAMLTTIPPSHCTPSLRSTGGKSLEKAIWNATSSSTTAAVFCCKN